MNLKLEEENLGTFVVPDLHEGTFSWLVYDREHDEPVAQIKFDQAGNVTGVLLRSGVKTEFEDQP